VSSAAKPGKRALGIAALNTRLRAGSALPSPTSATSAVPWSAPPSATPP